MAVSGHGTINVRFDKPFYAPGDQVNGYIYLDLYENHPSNTIFLKICGVEEVKLVEEKWVTEQEYYRRYRYWGRDRDYWQYSEYRERRYTSRFDYWNDIPHMHRRGGGEEGQVERRRIRIDHYDFNPVFNHKFPVYRFNSAFIPAGQYSFPISFMLPKGMPATFKYEFNEHGSFCFGTTSYTCIASIDSPNAMVPPIMSTREFCVNQAVKSGGQMGRSVAEHKVKCCCCVPRGEVKICSYFERSDYTPGETAFIVTEIDNTESKVNVDHINGVFRQILKLTAKGFTKNFRIPLNKVRIDGVASKEKRVGEKAIRLEVKLIDKSSGKPVQPTCQGQLISNSYLLETTTKMDTCICCGSHPTASISANIFNKPFQQQSGWSQPSNWQPQVMSAYVANFSSDFQFNGGVNPNNAGGNQMANQGAMPQMGMPGMPGGQNNPQGQGYNPNMQMGGQIPQGTNNGYVPLDNNTGGQNYPDYPEE